MRVMITETFRPGKVKALYERFHDRGRMLPAGLTYLDSWVAADLGSCFQLMECDDLDLVREWIGHWDDLADFQVVPVVSSAQASSLVRGLDEESTE